VEGMAGAAERAYQALRRAVPEWKEPERSG